MLSERGAQTLSVYSTSYNKPTYILLVFLAPCQLTFEE